MVNKIYTLNWTSKSQKQMKKAYDYISENSADAAEKVINEIVSAVEKAIIKPEIYRPDKYKINNDGTYRAFELYHYRIAYRYKDNVIRVLHVRHTKQNPQSY